MEKHTLPELPSNISIRSAPLFKNLPDAAVERAVAHVVIRHHPANRAILLENDWGSSVYFILDGWVKVQTYNLDGKEVTLNILGKGELFGEMAALEEVTRSTDVVALTPTTIANIPATDFASLVSTEPQAGIQLTKLMARRIRQLNRRLRLRESDSTSRIADILLFLVEGQGKQTPIGLCIPNLPHRELSSLTGMARETVTRVLARLEKKELIRREQDNLYILNISALENMLL